MTWKMLLCTYATYIYTIKLIFTRWTPMLNQHLVQVSLTQSTLKQLSHRHCLWILCIKPSAVIYVDMIYSIIKFLTHPWHDQFIPSNDSMRNVDWLVTPRYFFENLTKIYWYYCYWNVNGFCPRFCGNCSWERPLFWHVTMTGDLYLTSHMTNRVWHLVAAVMVYRLHRYCIISYTWSW